MNKLKKGQASFGDPIMKPAGVKDSFEAKKRKPAG
jgi:hypothetical protein